MYMVYFKKDKPEPIHLKSSAKQCFFVIVGFDSLNDFR